MTNKTSQQSFLQNNEQRKAQIEGVRRALWIESAIAVCGMLLLAVLTAALGVTAWQLQEREHAWAEEVRTLGEKLKSDLAEEVRQAGLPASSPADAAPPKAGAATAQSTLNRILQASKDLWRDVKILRGQMTRLPMASEPGRATGPGPTTGPAPVMGPRPDGMAPGQLPATLPMSPPQAEVKVAPVASEQWAMEQWLRELEDELNEMRTTDRENRSRIVELNQVGGNQKAIIAMQNSKIQQQQGDITKFEDRLKLVERDLNVLTKRQLDGRVPDPNLVTLVLVVDVDTNLDILLGELMSLYAYHNTSGNNEAEGESLGIDISRGGQLLSIPTSGVPIRTLDALNAQFTHLTDGLQLQGGNVPRLEEIPKGLPSFFTAFPKQKQSQLILVVGSECSAPAPKSWDKVTMPVHVCVVNDQRQVAPDFAEKWLDFTKSKSGSFERLDVDFRKKASIQLVQTQFRFWIENRLCFGAGSTR